jgi:hypothetical protein
MAYIHIDLDEFSDEDLLDEMKERGLAPEGQYVGAAEVHSIVEKIWMARKLGVSADEYVNELVYAVLGRIL